MICVYECRCVGGWGEKKEAEEEGEGEGGKREEGVEKE